MRYCRIVTPKSNALQ